VGQDVGKGVHSGKRAKNVEIPGMGRNIRTCREAQKWRNRCQRSAFEKKEAAKFQAHG
jgi:hypothetical protein